MFEYIKLLTDFETIRNNAMNTILPFSATPGDEFIEYLFEMCGKTFYDVLTGSSFVVEAGGKCRIYLRGPTCIVDCGNIDTIEILTAYTIYLQTGKITPTRAYQEMVNTIATRHETPNDWVQTRDLSCSNHKELSAAVELCYNIALPTKLFGSRLIFRSTSLTISYGGAVTKVEIGNPDTNQMSWLYNYLLQH
jgi:hypothetical protein